jgi:hypothetical protein
MIDVNAGAIAARVARVRKVAGMIARLGVTVLVHLVRRRPEGLAPEVVAVVIVAEATGAEKAKAAVTIGPDPVKTRALPRRCPKSR